MNDNPLSIWQLPKALVTKPDAAYQTIHQQHHTWLPLTLLLLSTLLLWSVYMQQVDWDWVTEYLVQHAMGEVSPLEQEQYRNNLQMAPTQWALPLGNALVALLMVLLAALYVRWLPNKRRNWHAYSDYLALVSWSTLPLTISYLLSAIFLYLMNNSHTLPQYAVVFSINQVLRLEHPDYLARVMSINLFTLMSLWLLARGYARWSQRSLAFGVTLLLLPLLLLTFFGIL